MAKDNIRDYATDAFRFFARWGGKQNYVDHLLQDLQRQKGTGPCSPTEAQLLHKERILKEKYAEIADLEAVEMVLQVCRRYYPEVHKAVELVYFQQPDKELEWGDIKQRVSQAEAKIPASERQVYYWLRKARMLFAEERGLRTKEVSHG